MIVCNICHAAGVICKQSVNNSECDMVRILFIFVYLATGKAQQQLTMLTMNNNKSERKAVKQKLKT